MKLRRSGMLAATLLAAATMPAMAQEQVVEREAVVATSAEDGGYYKASDLIGMEVRGTDNQELGEVQDLFIARGSNEVEYLILDTGVFADLNGQQPVIPWTIVSLQAGANAGTHIISIPLTQERIKSSPMINLTDVDLVRSPAWVSNVNEFYATELRERRVSRPELDRSRQSDRDGDRTESDRPDANRPDTDRPGANRPRSGQRNPGTGTNPNSGNRPGAANPTNPERRPGTTTPDTSNQDSATPSDSTSGDDSGNKPAGTPGKPANP